MAKTKILYCGTDESGSEKTTLSMFANCGNEIFIEIDTQDSLSSWICLDRSTAIKLSKELRKEISYLKSE